jgi:tetratricopeptide (TPR) repeat protein
VKKLIFIIFILPFLSNCGDKKADNFVNENNIEYITTDNDIVGEFDRKKYPILQDAILLKLDGKTEKAIEKFNVAEKEYGGLIAIYLNRGVAYDQIGRNTDAISDFSKCLKIDENYLPALLNRGIAYVHLDKIDLGLTDINKAIDLNPNEPVSFLNRAVAYNKENKFDLACADLEKAKSLGIEEKYGSEMVNKMITELKCAEN